MQSYTEIPSSQSLQSSLSLLLNNAKTGISNSSGSVFPTANTQVGMSCYRTDQNKLYVLKDATPTWALVWDFAAPAFTQGADIITGIDLNTMITTGWFVQGSNANAAAGANYPEASAGLLSVHTDGAFTYQTYQTYDASTDWYFRTLYNSVWSSWHKTWHNNNDGPGSGMNADLLDGYQSSTAADASTVAVRDGTGKLAGSITGNAVTATAAANSSFATATTASEGQLIVNSSGQNSAYLYNNASTWGLYSASGGSLINYNKSDGWRYLSGSTNIGGALTISGELLVQNTAMYLRHYDTDWGANRYIHSNQGNMGFLGSDGGWRNYSQNDGAWICTGNVVAYSSDVRLKENFAVITDALAKVKKLGGYEFDWNANLCEEVGFIPAFAHEQGLKAQEVKEIIPSAVHRAPFDIALDGKTSKSGEDYLTVDYARVVPLLIAAINELQAEVALLKGAT